MADPKDDGLFVGQDVLCIKLRNNPTDSWATYRTYERLTITALSNTTVSTSDGSVWTRTRLAYGEMPRRGGGVGRLNVTQGAQQAEVIAKIEAEIDQVNRDILRKELVELLKAPNAKRLTVAALSEIKALLDAAAETAS